MTVRGRVRFRAALLTGHKGAAVEVPFDPHQTWGVDPVPLWRGRRGYPVRADINGVALDSAIVSRQRRLFLLVDATVMARSEASVGDVVDVAVWSEAGERNDQTPRARSRRPARTRAGIAAAPRRPRRSLRRRSR